MASLGESNYFGLKLPPLVGPGPTAYKVIDVVVVVVVVIFV